MRNRKGTALIEIVLILEVLFLAIYGEQLCIWSMRYGKNGFIPLQKKRVAYDGERQ